MVGSLTPKVSMDFLKQIVLFVVLYATARAAMAVGASVNCIALAWLPTGIALAAVMLWGRRHWPAIFLASLCIQLHRDTPIGAALGISFGNSLEALVAAQLLYRARVRTNLPRIYDVLMLILAGAVFSCFLSATIGMASLWLVGHASRADFIQRWLSWWFTNAGSDILVAPALLVWGGFRARRSSRRFLEITAFIIVSILLTSVAFVSARLRLTGPYEVFMPLMFAPLMAWAALRFGQYGTTLIILFVSAIVAVITLSGYGPLMDIPPVYNFIYLELLVIIAAITMMVLAAALEEQAKALRCLRRGETRLRYAKDQAEAANRSKSAFLANISHEIRTPLGAMLGFTDLLLDPSQSVEDCQRFTVTIKRNGELLAHIIDEILDLSKVEAGRLTVETLRFSLADMLAELTVSLAFKAKEKGLTLSVSSEGLIPRNLCSDPTRLQQILLNLIGNAVKFTDSGGVDVRLKLVAGAIHSEKPRAAQIEHYLEISIKDTGLGMTREQVERIFLPFSQGDNSMTRRFGGSGLGLFLARKLARALDGDLSLKATSPRKGSVFILRIPVKRNDCAELFSYPEPSPVPTPLVRAIPEHNAPLKNVRILLVEDCLDNQLLIGHILRLAGCTLELANNGGEGIDKAQRMRPDIVLMDIQMPEIDGHTAMAALRQQGYTRPIIALTAHAMKDERELALQQGFDDYLTKPVRRDILVATLSRWAEGSSRGTTRELREHLPPILLATPHVRIGQAPMLL